MIRHSCCISRKLAFALRSNESEDDRPFSVAKTSNNFARSRRRKLRQYTDGRMDMVVDNESITQRQLIESIYHTNARDGSQSIRRMQRVDTDLSEEGIVVRFG